jgi:hypothetical protein
MDGRDNAFVDFGYKAGGASEQVQDVSNLAKVVGGRRQENHQIVCVDGGPVLDLLRKRGETPRRSASEISAFSTFMTMTNNNGDNGSPCLSPRAWRI